MCKREHASSSGGTAAASVKGVLQPVVDLFTKDTYLLPDRPCEPRLSVKSKAAQPHDSISMHLLALQRPLRKSFDKIVYIMPAAVSRLYKIDGALVKVAAATCGAACGWIASHGPGVEKHSSTLRGRSSGHGWVVTHDHVRHSNASSKGRIGIQCLWLSFSHLLGAAIGVMIGLWMRSPRWAHNPTFFHVNATY